MFYRIGRKISAHLAATFIFCTILLMLLVGGLVQVLSLKNESRLDDGSMSSVSLSLSSNLLLNNELQQSQQQRNKFNAKIKNIDDQTSINSLQEQNNHNQNENEEHSFLNTKILYKPYSAAVNNNNNNNIQSTEFKQTNNNKTPTSSVTKSKTINSTVFKSVTPSITDRVIADLRKEEQLAAEQKERMNADSVTENISDNDDAIYIDADENEVNTMDSILVDNDSNSMIPIKDPLAAANENYLVPKLTIQQQNEQQQKPLQQMSNDRKKKGHIPTITIVARDKKSSSKKPITITKHFKSFRDDNAPDSDDDDYYDYSGSGDRPTIEVSHHNNIKSRSRVRHPHPDYMT